MTQSCVRENVKRNNGKP